MISNWQCFACGHKFTFKGYLYMGSCPKCEAGLERIGRYDPLNPDLIKEEEQD